jgi:hypothetical protein
MDALVLARDRHTADRDGGSGSPPHHKWDIRPEGSPGETPGVQNHLTSELALGGRQQGQGGMADRGPARSAVSSAASQIRSWATPCSSGSG